MTPTKVLAIISSERSGSNLLRTRLASNFGLHGPSAIQLFKAFDGVRHCKEAIGSEKRKSLSVLAYRLSKLHPSPWDLPTKVFESRFTESEHLDINKAIYLIHHDYARQHNCEGFVLKENFMWRYLDNVSDFPSQFFVLYLVRDPRDVFLSYSKVPGGPNTALVFARQWLNEQHECIRALGELSATTPSLTLRYEDFIANEDFWLNRIGDCFGLDRTSTPTPAGNQSPYFRNLDKSTNPNNSGKFLSGLSMRRIRLIERQCRSLMERHDYELVVKPLINLRPYEGCWSVIRHNLVKLVNYPRFLSAKEFKLRLDRYFCYLKIKC